MDILHLDELNNEQLDYIFNEAEEDDIDSEKYANGLIYRWYCKIPEKFNLLDNDDYYGSTTCIDNRVSEHKWKWNNINNKSYNYKVYRIVRENGGFDNWEFEIIEFYKCNSKKELELREKYYIKKFKPNLNTTVPRRSWKEYREDNKEKFDAYQKEHNKKRREHTKNRTEEEIEADKKTNRERYLKERDKRLEDAKNYYQKNKEEINTNKKIKYAENKDEINEDRREKYGENKDELNKDRREKYKNRSDEKKQKEKEKRKAYDAIKIPCPHCNKKLRRDSMRKHMKSQHPDVNE
jgi:hypothetical protein